MQNKTLILIPVLAVALAVSGCGKKEVPRGAVSNNNVQPVNQNTNTNSSANTNTNINTNANIPVEPVPVENGEEEIDTSDWQTYRNEEYGFEVKYPKEWNIYNASQFSEYDQERGRLELGFTYDEIVEGVRPMDNMSSVVIVIDEYKESYFEDLKKDCLTQETCGDNCRAGETCYNLQKILIDGREAIKYNYIGIDYGGPEWTLSMVKLNKNKILYIRFISKVEIEEHFSKDAVARIEKEIQDVKQILSTVKIW